MTKSQHFQRSFLVLIITFFVLHLSADGATITGTVLRIIDGDTVTLRVTDVSDQKSELRVRLADIDAPETSQPYGKKAASYLSSLILSRRVRIEFSKRDFFGRIIGTVFLHPVNPGDPVKKINSLLVTEGCAWHYRKYSKNKRLAQMEKEAREQGKGLWQKSKPMPPWKYRSVRKRERRSDCK